MTTLSQRILKALMLIVQGFAILAAASGIAGCSATRHVAEGEYLLNETEITIDGESDLTVRQLNNYLKQRPNHKALGLFKLQAGIYNLAGRDSTGRFNRFLKRIGEEPVIYDSTLTVQSARQLKQAMVNAGYNNATVEAETAVTGKKRKKVRYRISPGDPFRISTLAWEFEDPEIKNIVMADSAVFPVHTGDRLDLNTLDLQRTIVAERMRENGYFAFTKEYVRFTADTVAGSKDVDLTMIVSNPTARQSEAAQPATPVAELLLGELRHKQYMFCKVVVVPDFSPGDNTSRLRFESRDTVEYKGIEILYGPDRYLTPKAIAEQIFIRPGSLFKPSAIDRTYEALNRLSILRYVNIVTEPAGSLGDTELLDIYILLSRTKKMGVTLELEGTNSEGNFGVGGGVTFEHRNLAHAGERLSFKLRGAYESLSGNFDDLINDSYTEVATELGISFPKFMAPFVKSSFKNRMRASTEFTLTFLRQERPEYTRITAGAAWRYRWVTRQNRTRRTFDLIDINIVNLPSSTIDFLNNIAPNNPLLRYSYEDHFIMRMGYTWQHTNRRTATGAFEYQQPQTNTYTVRAAAETAGALLYAISSITGQKRHDDAYRIFGIQYSQYLKGEIEYTIAHRFTDRNSIVFHSGFGIAFPYGNSSMVPFEKRFYAGGANGVRGWSVRTLGPGAYDSRNSVTDFINQCGDISMILNLEYRNKLFWVLEGAVFVDAGNIWTIRDYPNQPGGVFKFNKFYRQIAAAYGIGLRMDFTYFLLRLDMGLKAHNPAMNQEQWPLLHPQWHRDFSFHFSVGYPF